MEKTKLVGDYNFSATDVNNHNIRIFIVDDDRMRTLLMKYLGKQGFRVKSVADEVKMDKIIARDNVDMIVLDLMMHGEDGLSICSRIRASGDETPIIILSARGEDTDRILDLEKGTEDYLAKLFNPHELLAIIHAILRRKLPNISALPPPGFGK